MRFKSLKIKLDGFGSFFGREKGCFVVRDKNGKVKKYPLFENEVGEVQIKTGNLVSSGALSTCGFWGIDLLVLTQRGNPVAVLKSLSDDSHVKTRVCQYEAHKSRKIEIARKFILAKLEGQNQVLEKYGFEKHDSSVLERIESIDRERNLLTYEGGRSRYYFLRIFKLFNEELRPQYRWSFKAYDGLNNLLNLAYEILRWKVHIALLKAKLEPYLGFLHSLQWGKPSLVCDFQEIYRYLIDDFAIRYCRGLRKKDFLLKTEHHSITRKGEREYLNNFKTDDFVRRLNVYFESEVKIPRIRVGSKQEIETLINEEALLFAKYLRNERLSWNPRIVSL